MQSARAPAGGGRAAVAVRRLRSLGEYVLGHAHLVWPPVGTVRFGSLRRLTPISSVRGADRGTPIDRYYIEDFLRRHAGRDEYVLGDITGHVLEIGDDTYTRRLGSGVTKLDILHGDSSNPQATIVGDLARADVIPSETFDCVICTQTLLLIYDVRSAVAHLHRILKPHGILLLTVPGISPICRPDADAGGDHWRFTTWSLRRLLREFFASENVLVEAYGNVLSAVAFLEGIAAQELRRHELDVRDPDYELLVAARARK